LQFGKDNLYSAKIAYIIWKPLMD